MIRSNKKKICIICEGYEEYEYLDSIIKLNVWPGYDIDLKNAESNGSIFTLYQFYFQNDEYDAILIVADTDRPQYKDFKLIVKKINEFHGVENFADKILIFGNPCTMQFILNHFSETCVNVIYSNKKKNSDLINSLTGVENYDAHKEQRSAIFEQINVENYNKMKANIAQCSTNYEEISSTNFLSFAVNLESKDYTWIEKIDEMLN